MQYTSDRVFQIWAFTVSHSCLLLRSPLTEEKSEFKSASYNIDIEFWGVGYIELPDLLEGISIVEITEDIPQKLHKYLTSGYKSFEVLSKGVRYYVVAAGCVVGKNNWIDTSRIFNPMLKYSEVLAK